MEIQKFPRRTVVRSRWKPDINQGYTATYLRENECVCVRACVCWVATVGWQTMATRTEIMSRGTWPLWRTPIWSIIPSWHRSRGISQEGRKCVCLSNCLASRMLVGRENMFSLVRLELVRLDACASWIKSISDVMMNVTGVDSFNGRGKTTGVCCNRTRTCLSYFRRFFDASLSQRLFRKQSQL